MKVEIKPGFLFPTQYWTAEFNQDIKELQKECYLIKKNDKNGTKKSNTGSQGYHSKDIKSFDNIPETKKLINQIGNCVSSIHQLNRKGSLYLQNFWINISGEGASNTPHYHFGCFSGVFFIKVPKNMQGGRFLFYRDFKEASLNSQEYRGAFKEGYKLQSYDYPINIIQPKENLLVVFPSWVLHGVETNLSNDERISLSFNFDLKK